MKADRGVEQGIFLLFLSICSLSRVPPYPELFWAMFMGDSLR